MKHSRRSALAAAFALTGALALTACGGDSKAADGEGSVKIAPQFGLAYLPHVVMKEQDLLKDSLPGASIKEVQLSGGGSVVEQLIAGAVDIGYMGTAPFLNAVQSGADLKAFTCLEEMPLDLMTMDESVKTIADLGTKSRVALPGPSSQQAVTMQVASFKEFGDAHHLDKMMVALPHPDAMAALTSGQEITAHFTQPPFVGDEQRAGAHSILNSFDVFGPHCLIVGVTSSDYAASHPKTIEGVRSALDEATTSIKSDAGAAADALIKGGDETPQDQLVTDIENPDVTWRTQITGLQTVADAMVGAGLLKEDIDVKDLVAEGTDAS